MDLNNILRKDLWGKCWQENVLESEQRNSLQMFNYFYVKINWILLIFFKSIISIQNLPTFSNFFTKQKQLEVPGVKVTL